MSEINKLTDVVEHWIQGRINTSVLGLLDRIDRLEKEVSELRAEKATEDFWDEIRDVVDKLVEEKLDEFTDSYQLSDAVNTLIRETNFRVEVR